MLCFTLPGDPITCNAGQQSGKLGIQQWKSHPKGKEDYHYHLKPRAIHRETCDQSEEEGEREMMVSLREGQEEVGGGWMDG